MHGVCAVYRLWARDTRPWAGSLGQADEAIRLADLTAARERTIVALGHEHDGIQDDAMELIDVLVEIPMIGTGASLNVAVAASYFGADTH